MNDWFADRTKAEGLRREQNALNDTERTKTPDYWLNEIQTRDEAIKERDGRLKATQVAHIVLEDENIELRAHVARLMGDNKEVGV